MLQKIPNAATRVNRPKTRPSPPKNSAAMARNANGAGMCIMPVKKPIVPVNPYPPNHPSIFWAPWAKNTIPSTNRRTVVAASLSVAMSLRVIESSPESKIAEVRQTPGSDEVSLHKDSFCRAKQEAPRQERRRAHQIGFMDTKYFQF